MGSGPQRLLPVVALLPCLLAVDRGHAAGQTGGAGFDARSRGRLVGFLDLPDIAGVTCRPSTARATLYAAPSTRAPRIGSIALDVKNPTPDGLACDSSTLVVHHVDGRAEPLPVVESGYEVPALIVRARRGRWYRVDVPRGSAWIERTNPEDFARYPDLLQNDRLTFLERWDGTLWPAPGRGRPVRAPAAWKARAWQQYASQSIVVDVLAVRRVGEETWLQVRLVPSPCGDEPGADEPPIAPWTGWLPAYTATGETSVWFSSRGC